MSKNPNTITFSVIPGLFISETGGGCIYNLSDDARTSAILGRPVDGCEIRMVDPEDGVTPRRDGVPGELQVRGTLLFNRYYNDIKATSANFVDGCWFRTGTLGLIKNGALYPIDQGQDTVFVHGTSHHPSDLENHIQDIEGVMSTHLAVTPYRLQGRDSEGFVIFYCPSFDLYDDHAGMHLTATHQALRAVCMKVVGLPPTIVVPVPVQDIERTALGDLSRNQLLDQLKQGFFHKHISHALNLLTQIRGATYVAPKGEVEMTIARIFAMIFHKKTRDISAMDNFFELGGTSIELMWLKRELETAFDLAELSVVLVIRQPTVRELGNLVNTVRRGYSPQYDAVVPLQLTGEKTPIFFVHPEDGEILAFINLAKCFRNERPFYALRARGFDEDESFFASLEEMVDTYVKAIKRVQPKGPYAVAGYSYGGMVAFEISKRLETAGNAVQFVGLVETYPDIAHRAQRTNYTTALLKLSCSLGLISQQDSHKLERELFTRESEDQLRLVWDNASHQRLFGLQLSVQKLDRWTKLTQSLLRCGQGYEFRGSISPVDVFHTFHHNSVEGNSSNGYFRQCLSFRLREAQLVAVPGDCNSLLDFDHVPLFHKILRERIESHGI